MKYLGTITVRTLKIVIAKGAVVFGAFLENQFEFVNYQSGFKCKFIIGNANYSTVLILNILGKLLATCSADGKIFLNRSDGASLGTFSEKENCVR